VKKKMLIELFIYVAVVIVAFIFLFTYKPKQKPIDVPADYKISRGEANALVSIK
jgi:hypothetical protein